MRIVVTEKQLKKIVYKSIGNQELSEEGEEGGAPESGASSDGEKKTGATKWESGVTRGPANQIGNTKWADIVGSQLKRGKANPLKEQDGDTDDKNVATEPKYDEAEIAKLFPEIPENPKQLKGRVYVGDMTYKTYWGQEVKIPQDHVVKVWKPSDSRQKYFDSNQEGYWVVQIKTKDGERIDRLYAPSPEGYLRKLFPDGTIKSIDTPNGKHYSVIVSFVDLNAEYNEKVRKQRFNPLNFKMEKPEAPQWIPKYGYWHWSDVFGTSQEIYPIIKKATIPEEYGKFALTHYTPKQDIDRYFNRRAYSGEKVPEGFDPNAYDNYLYELKGLQNQLVSNGSLLRTKFPQCFKKDGTNNCPKDDPTYVKLTKKQEELGVQIVNLYKKYASPIGKGGVPEFSYGLDPEQRKKFIEYRNAIDQKYKPLIQQQEQIMTKHINPVDYTVDGIPIYSDEHDAAYSTWEKLKKEYEQSIKQLNTVFNFDYWKPSIFGKRFDEIYDEWSTAISIAGQVVVALVSGGVANLLRGTAWAAYRALIYPALDVTFNGFMAAYEIHRGKDAEALLSIVCTLLPIPKYKFNVGKIAEEDALRLATKIRNAGPGLLSDPQKLQEFIALADDSERYILRNLLSLPKEKIKDGTDIFFKDLVDKAEELKIKIPAAGFKTWGPPFFKEIGFEAGPPLVVSVINGFGNFIKNNETTLPYTKEELSQIKEAFEYWINESKIQDYEGFIAFFAANELAKELKSGNKKAKEMMDQMSEMVLGNKKMINIPEEEARKIRIEFGLVKEIVVVAKPNPYFHMDKLRK